MRRPIGFICAAALLAHGLANQTAAECPVARLRWDDEKLSSPLARAIAAVQLAERCATRDAPPLVHRLRGCGMGSDFHTWGDSLCRAFSEGRALVTLPEWKYAPPATRAPFGGWFAPPHCPGAFVPSEAQVLTGTEHPDCAPRGHTGAQMRRAATEFLFRQPPPHVRTKACEILTRVFGRGGAPNDLILVQMRWDDKVDTDVPTEAITIRRFVTAVAALVRRHRLREPVVYLETQSPQALRAFYRMARRHAWEVRHALSPMTHKASWDATADARAENSLHALATLLVAVEARYYVLSTGSNWAKLIDDLRHVWRDALCSSAERGASNCTDLIDLYPDGGRHHMPLPAIDGVDYVDDMLDLSEATGLSVDQVAKALKLSAHELEAALEALIGPPGAKTPERPLLLRAVDAKVTTQRLAARLKRDPAVLHHQLRGAVATVMRFGPQDGIMASDVPGLNITGSHEESAGSSARAPRSTPRHQKQHPGTGPSTPARSRRTQPSLSVR